MIAGIFGTAKHFTEAVGYNKTYRLNMSKLTTVLTLNIIVSGENLLCLIKEEFCKFLIS